MTNLDQKIVTNRALARCPLVRELLLRAPCLHIQVTATTARNPQSTP